MSYEKNAVDRLLHHTVGLTGQVVLVPVPQWAVAVPVEDGFLGKIPGTEFLAARAGDIVVVYIGLPGDAIEDQLVVLRAELKAAVAKAGPASTA